MCAPPTGGWSRSWKKPEWGNQDNGSEKLAGGTGNRGIEEITAQLETVLPDTQVIELRTQAIAREDQRKLVTKYNAQQMDDYKSTRQKVFDEEEAGKASVLNVLEVVTNYVIPLIVLVCVIWLGLLAWAMARIRSSGIPSVVVASAL